MSMQSHPPSTENRGQTPEMKTFFPVLFCVAASSFTDVHSVNTLQIFLYEANNCVCVLSTQSTDLCMYLQINGHMHYTCKTYTFTDFFMHRCFEIQLKFLLLRITFSTLSPPLCNVTTSLYSMICGYIQLKRESNLEVVWKHSKAQTGQRERNGNSSPDQMQTSWLYGWCWRSVWTGHYI